MKKLRIGVLYGGPSAEHEISVKTGREVLKNLDTLKYDVTDIFLDKDRTWKIHGKHYQDGDALKFLKSKIDIVFIGLHGTFGEDGEVQKLLEKSGIVFTGSGSQASKLAMDKDQASIVLSREKLPVPKEQVLISKNIHSSPFGYPVIVKPAAQGSSVGVSFVEFEEQLGTAITNGLKYDTKILIQQYIKGREVSCGVLEDQKGNLRPLPPTELIPLDAKYFDYKAKYTPGATKEVTPPNLPNTTNQQIQQYAVQAHIALGCRGYSRTDMIVATDNVYIIETNTLPGMTATSILPQQAKVAGMTFAEMLDCIINAALRKKV